MNRVVIPLKKGNRISLLFIGDVFLGGEYVKYINTHNVDYDYAFRRVKKILRRSKYEKRI